jgi:hypothetical protein
MVIGLVSGVGVGGEVRLKGGAPAPDRVRAGGGWKPAPACSRPCRLQAGTRVRLAMLGSGPNDSQSPPRPISAERTRATVTECWVQRRGRRSRRAGIGSMRSVCRSCGGAQGGGLDYRRAHAPDKRAAANLAGACTPSMAGVEHVEGMQLVPPPDAIDREITTIQRENAAPAQAFREHRQRCIGQVHRPIRVLDHQFERRMAAETADFAPLAGAAA